MSTGTSAASNANVMAAPIPMIPSPSTMLAANINGTGLRTGMLPMTTLAARFAKP